jgi:hypothetical protein
MHTLKDNVFSRIHIPLGAIVIVIFLFAFSYRYYYYGILLPSHLLTAEKIYKGDFHILHPGIYWMNNILVMLTGLPIKQSMWLLLSLHVALTFIAINWVLKRLAPSDMPETVIWLFAMAVMFAMHIGLPGVDKTLYNFTPSNRPTFLLRNATYTGSLPYMFATFGLLMLLCKQSIDAPVLSKRAIAAGAFLFISALVKPSFAVSIIPAIGVCVLWQKRPLPNKLALLSVMFPAGFLILLQFYVGFVNSPLPPYASRLSLDPWAVWEGNNGHPLLSLLMGALFPFIVVFYRWRRLSLETRIAWLNLVIALIPYILIRQTGGWFNDRDFEWSTMNARQLLFLCSMIEWWRWRKEAYVLRSSETVAVNIAGIVLFVHVIFGFAHLMLVDQGPVT